MDRNFLAWFVEDIKKYDLDTMNRFLRKIKFDPEGAKKIITDNLPHWHAIAAFQLNSSIMGNPEKDAEEIFSGVQEHFAKELEAIKP